MLQRSQNHGRYVLLVHVGLWLLLVLAILGLRRRGAQYDEVGGEAPASGMSIPTARLESLFASRSTSAHSVFTNQTMLFSTRHFMPPAVREGPRRVELTYRGYYEVGSGPRQALVLVGNSLSNCPAGAGLVADLVISEMFPDRLVLTNASGKTNELLLNRRQTLAVSDP